MLKFLSMIYNEQTFLQSKKHDHKFLSAYRTRWALITIINQPGTD